LLAVTVPDVVLNWSEISGDDAVAVAMVDRLVDHAEPISLKRR
jgi:hypothetical protein